MPRKQLLREVIVALLPALVCALLLLAIHRAVTTPDAVAETTGLVEMGSAADETGKSRTPASGELSEPPSAELKEPPASAATGLSEL